MKNVLVIEDDDDVLDEIADVLRQRVLRKPFGVTELLSVVEIG